MKKINIILTCLILSITLVGCYSKKELTNPNPTNYIFEANIEQVRIAIVNNTEKYKKNWMSLWSKKEDKKIRLHTDIKTDAWLNCFGNFDSKVYYKRGKPLPYSANFHIHLDSISENKTKVEIFTLNPEIVLGVIMYGGMGHGHPRVKEVLPSTMEEYEILLAIGEQLGEIGMPECNYPLEWLQYKAKQQEQLRQQKEEYEQKNRNYCSTKKK